MITRSSMRARIAAIAMAMALTLGIMAVGSSRADAANTHCTWTGEGWACQYYGNSWPKDTLLWFDSGGNNLRNFWANLGLDTYGGTVYKCQGYMDSGGGQLPYSCGTFQPVVHVPSHRRPGYVFMWHSAPGPRNIYGSSPHG